MSSISALQGSSTTSEQFGIGSSSRRTKYKSKSKVPELQKEKVSEALERRKFYTNDEAKNMVAKATGIDL